MRSRISAPLVGWSDGQRLGAGVVDPRAGADAGRHRRGHGGGRVLAEVHLADVDEGGERVGLRGGGARVARVDEPDRPDAHRRAARRHRPRGDPAGRRTRTRASRPCGAPRGRTGPSIASMRSRWATHCAAHSSAPAWPPLASNASASSVAISESSVPSPVNPSTQPNRLRDLLGAQPLGRRTHRVADACPDDDGEEPLGQLRRRARSDVAHHERISRAGPRPCCPRSPSPAAIASSHRATRRPARRQVGAPPLRASSIASARSLRASDRRKSTRSTRPVSLSRQRSTNEASGPDPDRAEHDLGIEADPVREREDLARDTTIVDITDGVVGQLDRRARARRSDVADRPHRLEDLGAASEGVSGRRRPGSPACPPRRAARSPSTGASRTATGCSRSARDRIAVGPTVDMSIEHGIGPDRSRRPHRVRRRRLERGGVGEHRDDDLGAAGRLGGGRRSRSRPARRGSPSRPGVRFQTRRSWPASSEPARHRESHRAESEERDTGHGAITAHRSEITDRAFPRMGSLRTLSCARSYAVSTTRAAPDCGCPCSGSARPGGARTRSSGRSMPTERRARSRMALDAGINLFDTAETYGDGRCEEMLGAALGARRDDAVIATKVFFGTGDEPDGVGLSRRNILHSCEGSLRRLKTDRIDILQMHGWDGTVPLEETLSALDTLVTSGKVRHVGVSNWSAWHLMKALGIAERDGSAAVRLPADLLLAPGARGRVRARAHRARSRRGDPRVESRSAARCSRGGGGAELRLPRGPGGCAGGRIPRSTTRRSSGPRSTSWSRSRRPEGCGVPQVALGVPAAEARRRVADHRSPHRGAAGREPAGRRLGRSTPRRCGDSTT